jgi:rhodanese-related sulfurtransferase
MPMTDAHDLPDNPPRYPFNPELEVSVVEVASGLGKPGLILLDIRERFELDLASVARAVHIPMGELAARVHEIDLGEEDTLALICHTGRRSLHAAQALQRMGIDQARSVAGGIEWWSRRIDPGVPRY